MPSLKEMECAKCKKPAVLSCGGCKDCPNLEGGVGVVRYCNTACQKEHWATHKATCRLLKDRQLLYRVAATAQQLYYIFKELTWYLFEIETVDKKQDGLFEWKWTYPGSQTIEEVLNLRGNNLEEQGRYNATYPVAIPFAAKLFTSKHDREAALSYLGGIQGNSWMVEFIQGMLDPIVKDLVFVEHRTKGEKRLTKFHPNQKVKSIFSELGAGAPMMMIKSLHYVIKVQLRSGETFAVDLAGAQFGHHEPVIPWNKFEDERILNFLSVDPVEAPKGLIRVHDYSPGKIKSLHHAKHAGDLQGKMILDDILELMNLAILHWQKDCISLKDLWKLPEDKFLVRLRDLVNYVDWSMNFEAGDLQNCSWYRTGEANGRELGPQRRIVSKSHAWVFGIASFYSRGGPRKTLERTGPLLNDKNDEMRGFCVFCMKNDLVCFESREIKERLQDQCRSNNRTLVFTDRRGADYREYVLTAYGGIEGVVFTVC